MEKDFQNLKEGQGGVGLILKGMFGLLFRPLYDIGKLFYNEIIQNLLQKKWKDLGLAIIPIILIFGFIIYAFLGLWQAAYKTLNADRYKQLIIDNSELEVENFFKKYEERFLAHDCGFMREVGADELMFDKLGKTSYGVDEYDCTIFDKVQRIKMLPIKIGIIEEAGNKLKVRGEMVRIEITNGKPLYMAPIRFELWKTVDMEFWHFNLYGNPNDRWIESKFKDNY